MPHASEFVWTWNIFLTLAVGIILIVSTWLIINSFKRQFATQDEKNARIAELLRDIVNGKAKSLAEKEEIKSEHLEEWRENYTKKIDCVKETVEEIKEELHKKVPWEHCETRRQIRDEEIKQVADRLRLKGL